MAARRPPLAVPVFTPFDIKLAELCAKDLWNGIHFATKASSGISDERLLKTFYDACREHQASPSPVSVALLRQLIYVCRLGRSTPPSAHKPGIAALLRIVGPFYKASTRTQLTHLGKDAGVNAILELASAWVKGRHGVPLSTRLLFFCVPEMMIFNFSRPLGKAMHVPGDAEDGLKTFNTLLAEGMRANKALLTKLRLPRQTPVSVLSKADWLAIGNTTWWQRRVLDIALMIRFTDVEPHCILRTEARALTR